MNPHNTNNYIDELFCYDCLAFPHYSIEVREDGTIFMNHICNKENKRLIFEINIKKNVKNEIKCYNCKSICNLICTKCDTYMCDKCAKYHFNYIYVDETESEEEEEDEEIEKEEKNKINNEEEIEEEFEEEKKLLYVNILEKQFICKTHLFKFTHYCEVCKINLCKECIISHYHINNNCFSEIKINKEFNKFLEEEPKDNEIINKLLLISKFFRECFISNKNKNSFTINIILNYQMINNIISFIENNITNKREIKEGVISNQIAKNPNKSYLFKNFMSKSFQNYYETLIKRIQIGHIDSYKLFQNIQKFYNITGKNNNELKIINRDYKIFLSISLNDTKINISFIEDIMKSSNFFLYTAEFTKLYDEILLQMHILQYNYELLKKIAIELNYKLDFQLRRKAVNLLTKEIFNKYYKNIDKMNITKYRLMQSSIIIKNKIMKNIKNNNLNNENLENSLKKCQNLIEKNFEKDFEKLNINKFEEEKNEIIFINIDNSENEKLKVVLLNLFILIRKELNNKFNYSIHNETKKINLLTEKKKEKNKKKIQNTIILEKNNENNKLLCKEKLKIIELIKKNITTKKVIKKEDIEINSLFTFMDLNIKNDISKYTEEEFIKYLDECKKLYDINNIGDIENIIEYIYYGNKNNLMLENKYYENKDKIKKEIETIKKKLKKEKTMKYFLKKMNNLLNKNIKDLNESIMEEINLLEDYQNYYNIKLILKNNHLKKEVDPLKIIKKKNNYMYKDPEEKYFLYTILTYLIIEKNISKINDIKIKIKNLNLLEFHKDIMNKIEIINLFMSKINENSNEEKLFNDIWEELKKKDTFINNDKENLKNLNDEIKIYVNKNNGNKFVKDFINIIQKDIEYIDLSENDPQNLDIIPFMKQYGLDI